MRVLVTGGTGFIGFPLVKHLLEQGAEVVVLVRNPQSQIAKKLEQYGATLLPGDVTNPESCKNAMQHIEVLIHNAGVYEYGVTADAARKMEQVNVQGTKNVLEAALEAGVQKCVYVSTTIAYGASQNAPRDETYRRSAPYGSYYERTKTQAHRVALEVQQRGLPLTIVCPNAVVGANDHSIFGYMLRFYLLGLLPPLGWSKNVMLSLVHLEDVVRGIALAAQKAKTGETYFLCGEAHSKAFMLETWYGHKGGMKSRVFLPPALLYPLFAALEPLQRALGLPAIFSRELVGVGSISLFDTCDKAKRDFGYTHRSAKELWDSTVLAERQLLEQRPKRDLLSMLRPLTE
ncbi:MAG: SDR family NAD(P)-dependent oxidoreductase [Deinococcales bacterium]